MISKIEQIEDWYQIYRDDILANKVLTTTLPFEDFKVDIERSERIIDYLATKGEQKEYDVEEIKAPLRSATYLWAL